MRAVAVYPGKANSMHLREDVPEPRVDDVPGRAGVLVQVLRIGVDGTDKEINEGRYGRAPEGSDYLIIGHENLGRVFEARAEAPANLRPGTLVVSSVRRPGGSVYDRIGLQDFTTDDVYYERGINLLHGYLAERYVEDATYVVALPDALESVGVLLEPLTVSEKGLNQAFEIQRRLKVWQPRRAAVLGAGTIGMLAALAMRLRGIDVVSYSLREPPYLNSRLIEAIGGAYVSSKQASLAEASEARGPFDIIFEATGYSPLVFEAAEVLAKNGVLVLSSVTGGDRKVEVSADRINQGFVLGNKVMVGTVNASRADYERGVDDLIGAEARYPGLAGQAAHDAGARDRGLRGDAETAHGERRRDQGFRGDRLRVAARTRKPRGRRKSGAERQRLEEARSGAAPWRLWGPYLAERQWGTVREDYSPNGDAWDYFPHDQARWRAYRWGEDGLLGFCDEQSRLCFSLALWNEADPILKERFFGVTNPQGNHGEDVKEYYFYLDATPTHSYAKALYKYPQRAYPYAWLLEESRKRDRDAPEYELIDTGVFDEDRYFDVSVEYAKASPTDVVVRIAATNRGPDPAPLRLLPTMWFRNTWSWAPGAARPVIREVDTNEGMRVLHAVHEELGEYWLSCEGAPELLFTENETNERRLAGHADGSPRAKDAINDAIVLGAEGGTSDAGTKAAAHYRLVVAPGATETLLLRLSARRRKQPLSDAAKVIERRIAEADAFYDDLAAPGMPEDARSVQRQAFAGLLWSKEFYYYDVDEWLRGDPAGPAPPEERLAGRNSTWRHLNNADLISMPDKWEYPWYAAWDLAFHCIPLAMVDAEFAKGQLLLMLREWYMHPNGQLPAYEWAFDDVNPPVHAWAVWRVYKIEQRMGGRADRAFLERAFHKLLVNFTWWVNRKDSEGSNVFQGGFLGLDNIGVFDRNMQDLPGGEHLEQADGTAWMGMYSLNMLAIALELARKNRSYEDIATKFFEHFLYIANALNNIGDEGISLWDEEDEFFYDALHVPHVKGTERLKVRSLVGLIPLLAVETIEPGLLQELPDFKGRLEWFLEHRPALAALVSSWHVEGKGERRLLALVHGHRMKRLLSRMLDEEEFFGHHGVRSLSRYHLDHPYMLDVNGMQHEVRYEPAESRSPLFGGNSNWRGPVWFPINFLLIESLQKFHHYYGDDFLVECPTGSGEKRTLWEIADELSRRLTHIFLRDDHGRRHVYGEVERFQTDPHWRDHVPFHEYFHGDTGAGLGASHQTGWTGLVAKLLDQTGGR